MSMSSLGMIGSMATTSLAQAKGSDVDRVKAESVAHAREVQSANSAELAAGIGDVLDQGATSDRDGDGRQVWEWPTAKTPDDTDELAPPPTASRDASGQSGSQLDLMG
jgi:hypothetical protein